MMKWILGFLLSILVILPVYALNSTLCLKGCPNGSPATNDVLQRPIYVLSNNGTTKFADWIAYKVEEKNFGPTKERNFKYDPGLSKSKTMGAKDYKGANKKFKYEKGHLAPLASFDGSSNWAMTNYMSNVAPQHENLNGEAWARLEAEIRKDAEKWYVSVYVVTGALYETGQSMPRLPKATKIHRAPTGFYKVISTLEDGRVWATTFVFSQVNTTYTSYQ